MVWFTLTVAALVPIAMIATACGRSGEASAPSRGTNQGAYDIAPRVDHHQHLLSPTGAALVNARGMLQGLFRREETAIVANELVVMLDAAGIERAVVVSDAYYFDSPRNSAARDPYADTRAENDWTAQQVSQFRGRLIAFCSFNPLMEYAFAELERCAKSSLFKGLKLHFGGSIVNLDNPEHVEKVRRVFQAANSHRLPIIVHVSAGRAYGREHVEILLNQILAAAPDIPIQIAHLWGGDRFREDALIAYADAVSARHRATKNLYFDAAELARVIGGQEDTLQTVAALMRRIGIARILYGSDGPYFGNWQPRDAWAAFLREVPLTDQEFIAIANNVAPYLR